jgi:alpha-mannosidase
MNKEAPVPANSPEILHLIANAHIDLAWLWPMAEGNHEVLATYSSAVNLLDQYPDLRFTSSSAQHLDFIKRISPPLFEQIKDKVKNGQWELAGGMWVEPDCNIPSGEAFARHFLYSQHFYQEHFGVSAITGLNPDSFGHSQGLVQLLRKSGLKNYIFERPTFHEKPLPSEVFWWEGQDGSKVLTGRIPFEYCAPSTDISVHVNRCASILNPDLGHALCFFGVGNHGGGPTRENLDCIKELSERSDLPHLHMSTLQEFFSAVREQVEQSHLTLPTLNTELQHHSRGCYADHSEAKRLNRLAENTLVSAEKFATVSHFLLGLPQPREQLSSAWKTLLTTQFHDILDGTCIPEVYDISTAMQKESFSVANQILTESVIALAWNINIELSPLTKPLVAFNPHVWTARLPIEIEVGKLRGSYALKNSQGQEIVYQCLDSAAACDDKTRICFIADLPSLGYDTLALVPVDRETSSPEMLSTVYTLENEFAKLQIDPQTGCISSFYDKSSETEVVKRKGDRVPNTPEEEVRVQWGRPVVISDPSDTWGHHMEKFDREIGNFSPTSITLLEHGPVKSTIRVVYVYENSSLTQDFTLYRHSPDVHVRVDADWHEHEKMLKFKFPCNLDFITASAETPYGYIHREANGAEEPCQSWVDISGTSQDTLKPYGVSVLNDGKYSYAADVKSDRLGSGKTLELTALRSPRFAHHSPYNPADHDRDFQYLDQGRQTFHYVIHPHSGHLDQSGVIQAAAELNQPPAALMATFHSGKDLLPQSASFISVDNPAVITSSVKTAEDNSGDLIIRCFESQGHRTHTAITLPHLNRQVEVEFSPHEIKTIRIPVSPQQVSWETDILENPLRQLE